MQVVDMNDPEVIESLKYLLVPKEERIRVQAQPFDGKKNCFVPDHKEGFLPAEVQSTEDDGTVVVRTSKGEVCEFF
jgi:myosin heavy chain 6/7